MFANEEEKAKLKPLPIYFESFEEYRDKWIPLFLYETYN